MPTQSIAFAPRRLSAERLDRIDADWRPAARLYERPDASGSARELPPPEERFAYFVREMTHRRLARGRAVARCRPGLAEGRSRGRPVAARAAARARLRRRRDRLSELSTSRRWPRLSRSAGALDARAHRAALRALHRAAGGRIGAGVDPAGRAPGIHDTDQAAAGLELLREALHQQPEDGKLRNLVAMAELRQCCAGDGRGSSLEAGPADAARGSGGRAQQCGPARQSADDLCLAGGPARRGRGETGALATGVVRVNANLRAGPSTDAPEVGLAERGSRIRFHRYRRQRSLAARRPRRRAGRVRRGASRSWSRAFRAGMRQGHRDHSSARRSVPVHRSAHQFPALAQLFQNA